MGKLSPYLFSARGANILSKQKTTSLLLLFALMLLLTGCGSVAKDSKLPATTSRSVASPNGKYVLKVIDEKVQGVSRSKFAVGKNSGNSPVIYTCPDSFRTDDTLYFVWDNNDRVWVYSDDAGTFYWTMTKEDLWERHDYFASKEPAPDFLKKAKPANHPY
jgi:hypothetical protein